MTGFPVDEARAHVEGLLARHGIESREVKKMWDGEASYHARTVFIPDPTTPLRYMVCLHEIGHLVDKVSAGVVHGHLPACEAAAWAWAAKHSRPGLRSHLTDRDWRRIGGAWVTSLSDSAPRVR